MVLKRRTPNKKAVEKLATDLADKPYGDKQDDERIVRTSLSLPASMQEALEDMAIRNKRSGRELRTVSAIVRKAVENFISNTK